MGRKEDPSQSYCREGLNKEEMYITIALYQDYKYVCNWKAKLVKTTVKRHKMKKRVS